MQMMQHVRSQKAVHAEKLVFLSDIEGVYKDKDDPNTLISELHVHEAEKLISEGLCRRRE